MNNDRRTNRMRISDKGRREELGVRVIQFPPHLSAGAFDSSDSSGRQSYIPFFLLLPLAFLYLHSKASVLICKPHRLDQLSLIWMDCSSDASLRLSSASLVRELKTHLQQIHLYIHRGSSSRSVSSSSEFCLLIYSLLFFPPSDSPQLESPLFQTRLKWPQTMWQLIYKRSE